MVIFQNQQKTMAEFWLISAPGDKTCQQTFDKLNASTSRQNNLSTNYKFNLPELKVIIEYIPLPLQHPKQL